ncbi:hypothetical protein ACIBH1_20010 [Nonomuraea sp. NPDC050663]|uniref:hypothetical protein n=1 Tax=Nonomuraea sp. NPDC050663 TaxID=3364370 RepID=UPI00379AA973
MTSVQGAREELDRARDWLHEQMRALATELTGDPAPSIRTPERPQIGAWEENGEAIRFTYALHAQDLTPRPGLGDPVAAAASWLRLAGWEVVVRRNVDAERRGCRVHVYAGQEPGAFVLRGTTPTVMLHEPRSDNPAPPACPGCGQPLRWIPLRNPRAQRRLRPEVWWSCQGCAWVGHQAHEGEELVRMRHLEGEGCHRCGEEGALVATEPVRDEAGQLCDWVVCLDCGVSDGRRWAGGGSTG